MDALRLRPPVHHGADPGVAGSAAPRSPARSGGRSARHGPCSAAPEPGCGRPCSPPKPVEPMTPRDAPRYHRGAVVDGVDRGAMVGRASELAPCRRPRRGGGRTRSTVIIGGEAGIGKSRLVASLADNAREGGAYVLGGACLPAGSGAIPYAPFVEALRGLTRSVEPARLAALLGPARNEVGAAPPRGGDADRGRADAGSNSTAPARRRLFEADPRRRRAPGAQRPVVLVIEDIQWADDGTRGLLGVPVAQSARRPGAAPGHVPDRRARSSRSGPRLRRRARAGRVGRTDRPPRGSIVATSSRSCGRLGPASSGGHRRRGHGPDRREPVLRRAARGDTRRDEHGRDLPPELRDVLVARLSGLPETTRSASCAPRPRRGRRVDEALLAAVLEVPPQSVADALRPAISQGILVDADRVDDGWAAIRSATRSWPRSPNDELLHGERDRLHAAFGGELERRGEVGGVAGDAGRARVPLGRGARRGACRPGTGRRRGRRRAGLCLRRGSTPLRAGPRAVGRRGRAVRPRGHRPDQGDAAGRRMRRADRRLRAGRRIRPRRDRRGGGGGTDGHPGAPSDPNRLGALHERLRWYLWEAGDRAAAQAAVDEALRLIPAEPPTAPAHPGPRPGRRAAPARGRPASVPRRWPARRSAWPRSRRAYPRRRSPSASSAGRGGDRGRRPGDRHVPQGDGHRGATGRRRGHRARPRQPRRAARPGRSVRGLARGGSRRICDRATARRAADLRGRAPRARGEGPVRPWSMGRGRGGGRRGARARSDRPSRRLAAHEPRPRRHEPGPVRRRGRSTFVRRATSRRGAGGDSPTGGARWRPRRSWLRGKVGCRQSGPPWPRRCGVDGPRHPARSGARVARLARTPGGGRRGGDGQGPPGRRGPARHRGARQPGRRERTAQRRRPRVHDGSAASGRRRAVPDRARAHRRAAGSRRGAQHRGGLGRAREAGPAAYARFRAAEAVLATNGDRAVAAASPCALPTRPRPPRSRAAAQRDRTPGPPRPDRARRPPDVRGAPPITTRPDGARARGHPARRGRPVEPADRRRRCSSPARPRASTSRTSWASSASRTGSRRRPWPIDSGWTNTEHRATDPRRNRRAGPLPSGTRPGSRSDSDGQGRRASIQTSRWSDDGTGNPVPVRSTNGSSAVGQKTPSRRS